MNKAPKCPECPPAGAPDWIVTYGDMMTLLLCFFVMLFAMSEITIDRFSAVMFSFQNYIGKNVAAGLSSKMLRAAGAQRVIKINLQGKADLKGVAQLESIFGQHSSTTKLKPGLKIALGGKAIFDHGRAELKPEAKSVLRRIAKIIGGFRNKIEVRGHTSTVPLPEDSPYKDKWELSVARAINTTRFLINEGGLLEARIRVSGASRFELMEENFIEAERMQNRRVEIFITEEYIVFVGGEENAGR